MEDLKEIVARTSLQVERISAELAEFREERRKFREHSKSEKWGTKEEKSDHKEEMRKYWEERKRDNREFYRRLADIAVKQGLLIDDIVAPNICRAMKQALGFDEETLCFANARYKRDLRGDFRQIREFDVVAECHGYVMINETGYHLKPEDVTHLIDTVAIAREYFPEYRDRKIIGSVASVSLDESVVNFATSKGILALGVGDELMDIQNPTGFVPSVW